MCYKVAFPNKKIHITLYLYILSLIEPLKILQKKNTINRYSAKYNSHTEPIFKALNILKLHELILLNKTKLTQSVFYSTAPLTLYFKKTVPQVRLRYNTKNVDVNPRLGSSLIFFNLPYEWNNLEDLLKETENRRKFKNKLKLSLVTNYNDSKNCTQHCRSCPQLAA